MTNKSVLLFAVLILIFSASVASASVASAADSRIEKTKVDGDSYYPDSSEAVVVFAGQYFESRARIKDCPDGYYLEYKIPKDSEERIKIVSQTRDGEYYVASFKVLDMVGNAEVFLELKDSDGNHKGQSSIMLYIDSPYAVDDPTFSIDSSQGDKKKVHISIDNGLTPEQEKNLEGEWDVTISGGEKSRHFSSNDFSVDLPGGYSYHIVATFKDKLGRSYQGEEDFLVENLKLSYRGEEKIEILSAPTVSRVGEAWSAKFKIHSDGNCNIYVLDGQKVIRSIPYNASEDSNTFTVNYVFTEPGVHVISIEAKKFAEEKSLATATIQVVVGDGSQIGVQQNSGQPYYDSPATSHERVNWSSERMRAEEQVKKIEAQNKESSGFGFLLSIIMFVLALISLKKKK